MSLPHLIPFHYLKLIKKHLDERLRKGSPIALSYQRAILETPELLSAYANILLQFEESARTNGASDLYAKVIRPLDRSASRYLIHFTYVPPDLREQLGRARIQTS